MSQSRSSENKKTVANKRTMISSIKLSSLSWSLDERKMAKESFKEPGDEGESIWD